MPKDTGLEFRAPRGLALRLDLLHTCLCGHPEGSPNYAHACRDLALTWGAHLIPACPPLSRSETWTPTPVPRSPAGPWQSGTPGDPALSPSALSHPWLRRASLSQAASGPPSVSRRHCPSSFPPGPFALVTPPLPVDPRLFSIRHEDARGPIGAPSSWRAPSCFHSGHARACEGEPSR